LIDIVFGLTSP